MKTLVKFGNKKISDTTMIFNLGSAHDCMSMKLGLCKVGDCCYALLDEKRYKNVLSYRRRQSKFWNDNTAEIIAAYFMAAITMHGGCRSIRFNESGDFNGQDDVDKMYKVAGIIFDAIKVRSYVYTARKDLKYNPGDRALTVNGSGFMVDNEFTVRPVGETVEKHDFDAVCSCNCRFCDICEHSRGKKIMVEAHGIRKKKLSDKL